MDLIRRFACYRALMTLSGMCLLMTSTAAETLAPWPQWQGPQRDAICRETGLLQQLPSDGPPLVWRFENCGLGYAGPAIVDGKLYILGAREGTDHLLCLDTNTGDELWIVPLGPTFENDWGDGPRSTPTVTTDSVFVLAPAGDLYCLDKDSGQIKWKKSLLDLGGKVPTWGYSESPLVMQGRVFCTPGQEQGAIAALDARTGELVWQSSDLADTAHYSSIVPMQYEGRTLLVQLLFKELVGVDPADGTMLWALPWDGNVAVVPTPIVSGNAVYCTAGYGAGCMRADLSDNDATITYSNKNMSNHHGGVILFENHLYGHSDRKGWICQDFATGEFVWREREALGKGAIAYADGRFYCLSEDTGELAMISASPDGWEEHGRFTLSPQTELRKPRGKIWTHPVIADGKLYLRDQQLLFCFDVRAE